jgi:hypothetical protein
VHPIPALQFERALTIVGCLGATDHFYMPAFWWIFAISGSAYSASFNFAWHEFLHWNQYEPAVNQQITSR